MDWQAIVIKGSEYPIDENQDCNDENQDCIDENQNNVEDNQDSAEESCGICSKVFKNKESLRKHHQTHKIEPSTCDVCDKISLVQNDLLLSKILQHTPKPFMT